MNDNVDNNSESLETPTTDVKSAPEGGNSGVVVQSALASENSLEGGSLGSGLNGSPASNNSPKRNFKHLLSRVNIYLLLFIFVIIMSVVIVVTAYLSNKSSTTSQVKTQSLSQDTLKQIANSDVTVGTPKQVLNVQSNAVFAGKVLINNGLDVVGGLQVGSSLSLPGISVTGNSSFDVVQISKTLGVGGDAAVQGQLTVQKGLSVAGNGTFGGSLSATQITASTLQINGDLNLTHHITLGGATPGRSNGGALGSGGTTSVSGSDSAGSINVNTGSNAGTGCFITVNFTQAFHTTPHVLVTPIGSSAAGLAYYVNRSTTSFSVCTNSAAPSSSTFGFDYFILD